MQLIKNPLQLYLVAVLALIILVVITELWINDADFAEALPDELNTFQTQQITVFLGIEALLTSLGTLIFAALGAIINGATISKQQKTIAILIFCSASLSIYLGYVCLRMLVWELDTGFLNLSLNVIKWPGIFQIVLLLIAAFLLGTFLLQNVPSSKND